MNTYNAEDILNKITWPHLGQLPQEELDTLFDEVAQHCKDNQWSKFQVDNLTQWARGSLNQDQLYELFRKLTLTKNEDNIVPVHGILREEILAAVHAYLHGPLRTRRLAAHEATK